MPETLLPALSILLFSISLVIILTKKHAIFILIGTEIMFNAAHLNLVVYNNYYPKQLSGQILVLLSAVMVTCEITIALAIILQVYKYYQTIDLDRLPNSN